MPRCTQEENELEEDRKEAAAVFKSFLEQYHHEDMIQVLAAPSSTQHYALNINGLEFFDINMHVGQLLLKKPIQFLPVFNEALKNAHADVMNSISEQEQKKNLSIKSNVHARFSNLPICPELTRVNIPKSEDVGSFLAVSGMFC